jgi:hypothetical protein
MQKIIQKTYLCHRLWNERNTRSRRRTGTVLSRVVCNSCYRFCGCNHYTWCHWSSLSDTVMLLRRFHSKNSFHVDESHDRQSNRKQKLLLVMSLWLKRVWISLDSHSKNCTSFRTYGIVGCYLCHFIASLIEENTVRQCTYKWLKSVENIFFLRNSPCVRLHYCFHRLIESIIITNVG